MAVHLDVETPKLDTLVRKGEAAEQLQDYYTALVIATSTGKIDRMPIGE